MKKLPKLLVKSSMLILSILGLAGAIHMSNTNVTANSVEHITTNHLESIKDTNKYQSTYDILRIRKKGDHAIKIESTPGTTAKIMKTSSYGNNALLGGDHYHIVLRPNNTNHGQITILYKNAVDYHHTFYNVALTFSLSHFHVSTRSCSYTYPPTLDVSRNMWRGLIYNHLYNGRVQLTAYKGKYDSSNYQTLKDGWISVDSLNGIAKGKSLYSSYYHYHFHRPPKDYYDGLDRDASPSDKYYHTGYGEWVNYMNGSANSPTGYTENNPGDNITKLKVNIPGISATDGFNGGKTNGEFNDSSPTASPSYIPSDSSKPYIYHSFFKNSIFFEMGNDPTNYFDFGSGSYDDMGANHSAWLKFSNFIWARKAQPPYYYCTDGKLYETNPKKSSKPKAISSKTLSKAKLQIGMLRKDKNVTPSTKYNKDVIQKYLTRHQTKNSKTNTAYYTFKSIQAVKDWEKNDTNCSPVSPSIIYSCGGTNGQVSPKIAKNARRLAAYDVSNNNNMDNYGHFTKKDILRLKHEVPFMILKAQEHGEGIDTTSEKLAPLLHKYHIPYGVYSYTVYRNAHQARADAKALLRNPVSKYATFYANDCENTKPKYGGNVLFEKGHVHDANVWSRTIQHAGKHSVLYASASYLQNQLRGSINSYNAIWAAAWVAKGDKAASDAINNNSKYDLWQFETNGSSKALKIASGPESLDEDKLTKHGDLSFWIGNNGDVVPTTKTTIKNLPEQKGQTSKGTDYDKQTKIVETQNLKPLIKIVNGKTESATDSEVSTALKKAINSNQSMSDDEKEFRVTSTKKGNKYISADSQWKSIANSSDPLTTWKTIVDCNPGPTIRKLIKTKDHYQYRCTQKPSANGTSEYTLYDNNVIQGAKGSAQPQDIQNAIQRAISKHYSKSHIKTLFDISSNTQYSIFKSKAQDSTESAFKYWNNHIVQCGIARKYICYEKDNHHEYYENDAIVHNQRIYNPSSEIKEKADLNNCVPWTPKPKSTPTPIKKSVSGLHSAKLDGYHGGKLKQLYQTFDYNLQGHLPKRVWWNSNYQWPNIDSHGNIASFTTYYYDGYTDDHYDVQDVLPKQVRYNYAGPIDGAEPYTTTDSDNRTVVHWHLDNNQMDEYSSKEYHTYINVSTKPREFPNVTAKRLENDGDWYKFWNGDDSQGKNSTSADELIYGVDHTKVSNPVPVAIKMIKATVYHYDFNRKDDKTTTPSLIKGSQLHNLERGCDSITDPYRLNGDASNATDMDNDYNFNKDHILRKDTTYGYINQDFDDPSVLGYKQNKDAIYRPMYASYDNSSSDWAQGLNTVKRSEGLYKLKANRYYNPNHPNSVGKLDNTYDDGEHGNVLSDYYKDQDRLQNWNNKNASGWNDSWNDLSREQLPGTYHNIEHNDLSKRFFMMPFVPNSDNSNKCLDRNSILYGNSDNTATFYIPYVVPQINLYPPFTPSTTPTEEGPKPGSSNNPNEDRAKDLRMLIDTDDLQKGLPFHFDMRTRDMIYDPDKEVFNSSFKNIGVRMKVTSPVAPDHDFTLYNKVRPLVKSNTTKGYAYLANEPDANSPYTERKNEWPRGYHYNHKAWSGFADSKALNGQVNNENIKLNTSKVYQFLKNNTKIKDKYEDTNPTDKLNSARHYIPIHVQLTPCSIDDNGDAQKGAVHAYTPSAPVNTRAYYSEKPKVTRLRNPHKVHNYVFNQDDKTKYNQTLPERTIKYGANDIKFRDTKQSETDPTSHWEESDNVPRVLQERLIIERPNNMFAKTGYGLTANDIRVLYMGHLNAQHYIRFGTNASTAFPREFNQKDSNITDNKTSKHTNAYGGYLKTKFQNDEHNGKLSSVEQANKENGMLETPMIHVLRTSIPDTRINTTTTGTYSHKKYDYGENGINSDSYLADNGNSINDDKWEYKEPTITTSKLDNTLSNTLDTADDNSNATEADVYWQQSQSDTMQGFPEYLRAGEYLISYGYMPKVVTHNTTKGSESDEGRVALPDSDDTNMKSYQPSKAYHDPYISNPFAEPTEIRTRQPQENSNSKITTHKWASNNIGFHKSSEHITNYGQSERLFTPKFMQLGTYNMYVQRSHQKNNNEQRLGGNYFDYNFDMPITFFAHQYLTKHDTTTKAESYYKDLGLDSQDASADHYVQDNVEKFDGSSLQPILSGKQLLPSQPVQQEAMKFVKDHYNNESKTNEQNKLNDILSDISKVKSHEPIQHGNHDGYTTNDLKGIMSDATSLYKSESHGGSEGEYFRQVPISSPTFKHSMWNANKWIAMSD